ncbi:MAG: hypothetical protein IJ782_04400 [Prevotella sp.]|nr:hypothetical protein [Prevotella sp.]
MKKFLSIALCMLAFCASATFVSCGDDDDNANDNAAVVTPEKQSTTDSPVYWTTDASFSASKVNTLEFKTSSMVERREYRNGTLSYSGQYTFAINGSTISLTGDFDGKRQTIQCTIKSWTDTQLVVDMGGETETYYKVTSLPY